MNTVRFYERHYSKRGVAARDYVITFSKSGRQYVRSGKRGDQLKNKLHYVGHNLYSNVKTILN